MKTKRNSFSIFSDPFDGMFVHDKHGELFVFPWGKQRNGYSLDDSSLKPKMRRFYWVSFSIYFLAINIFIRLQKRFLVCGFVLPNMFFGVVEHLVSLCTKNYKIIKNLECQLFRDCP
jgi:hypothetical protein